MFKRKKPFFSAEDLLQRAIVNYLRLVMKKGIVYHINNDGETEAKRKRNTAIGVLSGVADLHVIWVGGHDDVTQFVLDNKIPNIISKR